MQAHGMRKPRGSKTQLAFGNSRDGELRHGNVHKPIIDCRTVPFDDAARDIGVEQVEGHRQQAESPDTSEQFALLRNFVLTICHEIVWDTCLLPEFEEAVPGLRTPRENYVSGGFILANEDLAPLKT